MARYTRHDNSTLNVGHVPLVLVDFTAVNSEAESLQQLCSLLILSLTTAEEIQIQRRSLSDDNPRCTHFNNSSSSLELMQLESMVAQCWGIGLTIRRLLVRTSASVTA